jgi:hypothetical protein
MAVDGPVGPLVEDKRIILAPLQPPSLRLPKGRPEASKNPPLHGSPPPPFVRSRSRLVFAFTQRPRTKAAAAPPTLSTGLLPGITRGA